MAELKVKGEYVGPGEQKTAETLRDQLPDDWVIFAGRKLAGANRDDVDLIVVGKSVVFVLEEKAWGPRVVVDDNNWYVGEDRRPNPLNRVAQVSRKVAGLLRDHVKGYKDLRGRRVIPAVVMSHDRIMLLRGPHHDPSELIFELAQTASELVAIDSTWERGELGAVRHRVDAYLDDLPDRSVRRRIGDYIVDGELEGVGLEKAYAAHAADGQPVILKCYPISELRALGDPGEFLARERLALNKLADIGRTWSAHPPFQSDEHDLYVVPVVPPAHGTTLASAMKKPGPERPGGRLDEQVARDVIVDAFTALSDVHEYGLVHRALHPRRIWLARRMRVMFSDFHLARVSGATTIRLWAKDFDISEDFRAPECAADVGLASPKSDVYSLTLCLCAWLLAKGPEDLTLEEFRSEVADEFPWAAPMLAGLAESASDRPNATDLVDALTAPAPPPVAPPEEQFQPDSVIDGRYKIIRQLGKGGFATSWLVHDLQVEQTKVLKEFHQAVPSELRAEYLSADRLHHDRCGRVYDVQIDRASPYLVSEYVEGESLAVRGIDRDVSELRTIALGVLEALEYMHGKGLVHGDVTPANVIVATDGSGYAKLIDFGLAVQHGARPMGFSPKFAAPEVHVGRPTTPSGDIFGFAATLAYAMLGRHAARMEGGELVVEPPTDNELDAWGEAGALLLKALMRGITADPDQRLDASQFEALIRSARPAPAAPPAEEHDEPPLTPLVNENVTALRRLYRGSSSGNAGNRGLDDDFALQTYVPTLLDSVLLPRIVAGEFDLVLLSGNPGDGKTSVLFKLGEQLRALGAEVEASDEAGWQLRLGDHVFLAVFDASEAHGDLTSDQLVRQALDPVVSGQKATALIAVNDGRLLQFFTDNEDDYEELWWDVRDQLAGKPRGDSRVTLVDLKQRSLASLKGTSGLANQALRALTTDELWSTCQGCSSQTRCPILANRKLLAGPSAEPFGELILMSHLRRRRRATFRDVRSAAAWLITGDRSCADIHALEEEGRNPLLVENAMLRDLAFTADSNDYLVGEWSSLDPSVVAAPSVDSLRRALQADSSAPGLATVAEVARALFFHEFPSDNVHSSEVRPYRYLDEFLDMLVNGDADSTRDRLLRGISRLVGAFGFADKGLAMSSGMPNSQWAVLHTVTADHFAVSAPTSDQQYIETIPDQIVLTHKSGARLPLTLDTAEIILRAADGELIDDAASDAIRQEIDSFVSQLARQPSKSARLVDSSGSLAVATIVGPRLVLEKS